MTSLAVLIWVIATQELGNWWWLFGPCIAFDLIHLGYKTAKD